MKISLDNRVITILGDQTMSQQCYQIATKLSIEAFPLASLETEKKGAHPEPVEQVLTLQLSEGKTVKIGSELEPNVKRDISKVLT